MDIYSMSYFELNKLYVQVGAELIKRSWWLIPIVVVVFFIISRKNKN